jgi:DNA-binding XRE family transcriptional regulator
MLTMGNQPKAARALAELDQLALADAAEANVNTIRNMEAKAGQTLTSSVEAVRREQIVLEAARLEFLSHGRLGARPTGTVRDWHECG